MKFFVDTADTTEIKELAATGLIDGVTTNPSLITKSGRDFKEVIAEICDLTDGHVSAEVVATEWDQFRALDLERIKASLNGDVVVDLRNIYSPDDMAKRGFTYTSIGRPV